MQKCLDETLFEHISGDSTVKKKSVLGAVSIFVSQVLSLAINVGSLTILARLLDPQQFGLIGMIMAIANFAFIFQDFGLSMATIQKKTITHEQISSLFWLNIALGAVIMVVLCAAAPLIASLYGYSELKWLTMLISVAFLFSGMSVQHQALLKRRMAFLRLAIMRCISLFMAHFSAVLLAVWGAGVWALASIQVLTPLFMFLCCLIAMPWIPSFPRKDTQIKDMLGFGGTVAVSGIITYFSRNLDKILIGHTFGSTALGFYGKAYDLMLLPLTRLRGPLIGVATPALSGYQEDREAYRNYFIRFISLLSLVAFPLIVGLVLFADEIIRLVLGPDWMPAADLFRWLGIAGVFQPFNMALGTLLVSLGKTSSYLIWGVIQSASIVFSFILGLNWGTIGVSKAYALANIILFFPSILYCTNRTYIQAKDLVEPIGLPLICVAFAACVTELLKSIFILRSTLLILSSQGLCFSIVYIASILAIPKLRAILFNTMQLIV